MLTLRPVLRQPSAQLPTSHTHTHTRSQRHHEHVLMWYCRVRVEGLSLLLTSMYAVTKAPPVSECSCCICICICMCDAEMYEHASQVTGRGAAPRAVTQQPAHTPIATQTSAPCLAQSPALTPVTAPAPAPSYQDFESESEGSEASGTPGKLKAQHFRSYAHIHTYSFHFLPHSATHTFAFPPFW